MQEGDNKKTGLKFRPVLLLMGAGTGIEPVDQGF